MNPKISFALCLCLAALGLAAGLFAFPAHADNSYGAKSLDDLRALGYSPGHSAIEDGRGCMEWVIMFGNDAPWTVLGEFDQSRPECATDPALIQQRIDDLVAAYPPQPATTTAVDTTAATVPAATTTTATAPADVPAASATAPAAPGGTTTVTVTDPTVQAQIDALNAKIDALTSKVDKLAAANTASWSAFSDALTAGQSPADAALAARSAGLNSLYGL